MEQPLLDVIIESIARRIADVVTREIRAGLAAGPQALLSPGPASAAANDAELVDVEQASLITSIPKRTLENWRSKHAQRQGKGPPFVKLGEGRNALVRYRRQDLEDWARAHVIKRG